MTVLFVIAAIWAATSMIRAIADKAAASRAARERQRIAEEQRRQYEAIKAHERAIKEQARRQVENDKAIARAAKEREAMRKEQERQAAQLAKHDEEIRKLKQTAKRLSAKLEDLELRIIDLESVKELVHKQFLEAHQSGDEAREEKALRKLITIDNQLSAARDARQKTIDSIENAKRKISA